MSIPAVIKADLDAVADWINTWNGRDSLGLHFLGIRNRIAIWSVGNCLFVATQIFSGRVRLEMNDYKRDGCDKEARASARELGNFIREEFEELQASKLRNGVYNHIAQMTLQKIGSRYPIPRKIKKATGKKRQYLLTRLPKQKREQIERGIAAEEERKRRSTLTVEEAIREIWGAREEEEVDRPPKASKQRQQIKRHKTGESKPQVGTQMAIYQLSCYRIAMLNKTRKVPDRKDAMRKTKISDKKLRTYTYQLWYYWELPTYKQIWEYNEDSQKWESREYTEKDLSAVSALLAV